MPVDIKSDPPKVHKDLRNIQWPGKMDIFPDLYGIRILCTSCIFVYFKTVLHWINVAWHSQRHKRTYLQILELKFTEYIREAWTNFLLDVCWWHLRCQSHHGNETLLGEVIQLLRCRSRDKAANEPWLHKAYHIPCLTFCSFCGRFLCWRSCSFSTSVSWRKCNSGL